MKRYDLEQGAWWGGGGATMSEAADGEYVEYDAIREHLTRWLTALQLNGWLCRSLDVSSIVTEWLNQTDDKLRVRRND